MEFSPAKHLERSPLRLTVIKNVVRKIQRKKSIDNSNILYTVNIIPPLIMFLKWLYKNLLIETLQNLFLWFIKFIML